MRVIQGNLFAPQILKQADAICVTTNGIVKSSGQAVMGAGVAKVASTLWSDLPRILGNQLQKHGNRVHFLKHDQQLNLSLLSFPTKHDWKQPSDLDLIIKSTLQLVELASNSGWEQIYLPPPGCGLGGLPWPQVKEHIEHLLDDRFYVVFFPRA